MTDKQNAGHRRRLRERFIKGGAEAFAEHELLELLLTYSIPRKDVKPVSKSLVRKFGSLAGVLDTDLRSLESVEGIGTGSAVLLKLVRAIKTGYSAEKLKEKKKITSASSAEEFISTMLEECADEKFLVIYLDVKNGVIDHEIMFEGTLNQTAVYPRKILESVLNRKASSIIIAHNHPSGDPYPSREDINITSKIKTACQSADISLVDHLVVGKGRNFSFFTNGLL